MNKQFESLKTRTKIPGTFLLLLAVLGLIPELQTAMAQNYAIDWYKVSGGGGTSTGGTYSVSGTIWKGDEIVAAAQRVPVDHVVVGAANLLRLCNRDASRHRSEHDSERWSRTVPPTALPLNHRTRVTIQVRNYSRPLNQRAHEDESREQIRLPDQLPNAESDADTLRDDLASGPLESSEGV